MGTRHLIAVQLDGQYRIAQYGQWDGYPSVQGAKVLSFLDDLNREQFLAKLRAAQFYSQEELEAESERFKRESINWQKDYPWLNRDAGADILSYVLNQPAGIKLKNSIDFAGDSLMCEWAYVIDLDTNRLEVHEGFNKEPLEPHERFAKSPLDHKEYQQVRLVHWYSLDDKLPTVEEMEHDCSSQEVDE
jgi:hypothetical protein